MESWYSKLLSPVGKEVMIKVVLTTLPTYCMSCFLLSMKLINKNNSAIKHLVASNRDKYKILWIVWEKITKSKGEGGLGIRDIKDFNIALLAKQSWRMLQNPESLLARVYKAKYYSKTTLLEAGRGSHYSYAWWSIYQDNKPMSQGIWWLVGKGKHIRIRKDNWLPTTPSRPARSLTTNVDHDLKVSDLFIPWTASWDIPKITRLINQEDVQSKRNKIKRLHLLDIH